METKVKRLSNEIHQRVLGRQPYEVIGSSLRRSQEQLALHGLEDANDDNEVVNLPLPKGIGNYEEVAKAAIESFGQPILDNLEAALKLPCVTPTLPGVVYGWLRLAHGSKSWKPCQPPSGSVMVLDFETVDVNIGTETDKADWRPFLCCALDANYWYIWQADIYDTLPTVADFGKDNLVIAHNAGYDRSYLATEYTYEPSGNRFFDTMSAWIATRGFTNQQRSLVKLKDDVNTPLWVDETTTQGLKAIHKFYYPNSDLDKTERDAWVKEGISYIQAKYQDVVAYCFKDILATLEVYQAVYPELKLSQPNDISIVAQVMLGNTWLPLSDRWNSYYTKAEEKSQAILKEIETELKAIALRVLNSPSELQLSSLDWTPAKSGKNKGVAKWYRDCEGQPTIGSRLAVVLLEVTYLGDPVKWFQLTSNTGYYYTEANGKLPHPEKRSKNLSSIFCKGNVGLFESGVYCAKSEDSLRLIKDKVSTLTWVSLRKRVERVHTESPDGYLVTLPQLVVTGTVTRRCADDLWQVAANPKEKRIGTELKSMVEAPEGFTLVGADVASEELWITSALGDAVLGFNGATALGLATLIGDKAKRTDPHTLVAKKQAISRDLSKNIIYGICYGLALKGCTEYLLKANPLLDEPTAKEAATQLLNQVKGSRHPIDRSYVNGMGSYSFNVMDKIANSRIPTTPVLGAKISHCLRGNNDFQTTKTNWVIQSSGSDFRDLMVVYLHYFMTLLKVDGRLMLTIHDEFRYMVKEASTKRAIYAFQLSHLYTRAYFIDALGLDSLPAAASWFPEVESDKYLRKSPTLDCKTPSHDPLTFQGVSYTPQDTLSWFNQTK